ncbi:hypothetical protein ACFL6R_05750 [Gemmatimonadota bacterium]
MPYCRRYPFIPVFLICALLFTSCGLLDQGDGEDTGPLEEHQNALPNLAADSTNIAYLEFDNGLRLPYYRTYDLNLKNTAVTAALIIVHGSGRGAFQLGIDLADSAGVEASTLIITPRFYPNWDEIPSDEPYWSTHGWKWGEESLTDAIRPGSISSFDPIDRFIQQINNPELFPSLTSITIAGHSAGGQFAHRYAVGNQVEQFLAGITVRYVISNPSTYVYIRPERALAGTLDEFEIPDVPDCGEYNSWPYGFDTSPPYYSGLTLTQIQNQVRSRDMVYLAGDADTLITGSLDQSCGANYSGRNRYERSVIMKNLMDTFFAGHTHVLTVVPGVGHSGRSMFMSTRGLAALFN